MYLKRMVSIMELWLQVKTRDDFFISEPPGLNHTAVVFAVLAPLVYLDGFERPVIEMVCNGSSPVNDKQIRLTSHFLINQYFLCCDQDVPGLMA